MAIVWNKGYGPAISQAFRGLYGSMDRMDALDRQAAADRRQIEADRWRTESQGQQRAGWARREHNWRLEDRLRELEEEKRARALVIEKEARADQLRGRGILAYDKLGDVDPGILHAGIAGQDVSIGQGEYVMPGTWSGIDQDAEEVGVMARALDDAEKSQWQGYVKSLTGTDPLQLINRQHEERAKLRAAERDQLQLDALTQEEQRVNLENSVLRDMALGGGTGYDEEAEEVGAPIGARWTNILDDRTYLSILDKANKAKGPLKRRLYDALGVTWDDVNNAGIQNLQSGTLGALRDASGSESLLEYVPGQEIEVADQDLALIPSQNYQLDPTRRGYEERNAAERAQKEALLAAEIEATGLESARDRAAAKGAIAQAVSEGQAVLDPTEANIRTGLEEQNALAATRQQQAQEAREESRIAANIRQHQDRETAKAAAATASQDQRDRKAQDWARKTKVTISDRQRPSIYRGISGGAAGAQRYMDRLASHKVNQSGATLPMTGENANPAVLENIALQSLEASGVPAFTKTLLDKKVDDPTGLLLTVDRKKLQETFTQEERDTVLANVWEAAWRLSQQHDDGSVGVTRSYFDEILAKAENGEIDLVRTFFDEPFEGVQKSKPARVGSNWFGHIQFGGTEVPGSGPQSYEQLVKVTPVSKEQLQSNIANAMKTGDELPLEYALRNQLVVGYSEADALEQVELRPAGRYKIMYVLPNGQHASRWVENEPGID
tara:strand:- start:1056 stop:3233 length:2178 start_codon:yes stop_codon:yes gene_type:complete